MQRFPEVPRLTPKQLEALQAVTDLADSPDLHLDWGEAQDEPITWLWLLRRAAASLQQGVFVGHRVLRA